MTPAAGDSKKIRVAVVGTGEFGRNHARVYGELDGAELVGVFDENPERAAAVAAEFQTPVLTRLEELLGRADAASVAVPTVAHAEVGCRLLEIGLDGLVEMPMAVEFAGGAVANITASRVSTERVRKMRFFQQHEYISLDYARRDALRIGVKKPGPQPEFGFEKLNAPAVEPLQAELDAFVNASRSRKEPRTNGAAGRAALELATRVMASIQEHAARVQTGSFATQDKTR